MKEWKDVKVLHFLDGADLVLQVFSGMSGEVHAQRLVLVADFVRIAIYPYDEGLFNLPKAAWESILKALRVAEDRAFERGKVDGRQAVFAAAEKMLTRHIYDLDEEGL